jgi:hypothetical protein
LISKTPCNTRILEPAPKANHPFEGTMNFICQTCGTQYPASNAAPEHCLICEDERQYVGWNGQQWTTLEAVRATHHNKVLEQEPGLHGIGTEPRFAIGQRALLLQHPEGNILWDCVSLIDDETIAAVNALGGISKIAVSHPHFYASLIEWARAFGAQVFLPVADRMHVMRPDPAIEFWDGERLPLASGVTVVRCGGHFEGSSLLHWAAGAAGQGALFTSDTIQVVQDRRFVTFMRSYPNQIPLSERAVRGIVDAVNDLAFDRVYGGWWNLVIPHDAHEAVRRSAQRYIRAIGGSE